MTTAVVTLCAVVGYLGFGLWLLYMDRDRPALTLREAFAVVLLGPVVALVLMIWVISVWRTME